MQRIPLNELTFWLMRYGSKQANMNLYKSESSLKGAIRMAENLPSTEVMVDELKEWDKKYFIHPTTSPRIHAKERPPIICGTFPIHRVSETMPPRCQSEGFFFAD